MTGPTGERMVAGRYRLADMLGRGGMGTVWRARDTVLDRVVAVKEVRVPDDYDDEERARRAARAMREVRAAALVSHPNVVVVHDVVEDGERPWIIMEFVPGRTLAEDLDEGRLPVRDAARVTRQVLGALSAVHAADVVHRDIKPGNILLGPEGRAVLTDFGIATLVGTTTITATGTTIGTLEYMAPERAQGLRPGPASDLWSLGATLYEMLEGRSPFRRNGEFATLQAVLDGTYDPPRHAGKLAELLAGLLTPDPDRRLTADQALLVLDALESGAGAAGMIAAAETGRVDEADAAAETDEATAPTIEGTEEVVGNAADPVTVQGVRRPSTTVRDPKATGEREAAGGEDAAGGGSGPPPKPTVPPRVPGPPGLDELPTANGIDASVGVVPGPSADAGAGSVVGLVPSGGGFGPSWSVSPGGAAWERVGAPAPTGRSPRGRFGWVLGVAAVVVAGALIVAWIYVGGDDDKKSAAGSGSTVVPPTSLPSTSPPPSSRPTSPPPTTTPPTSPVPTTAVTSARPGFHRVVDPAGFSLSVPDGWSGRNVDGDRVFFRSPGDVMRLGVRVKPPDASGDPYDDLARQDAGGTGASSTASYPGYRQVQLTSTTFRGSPAAVWEFTWNDGGTQRHSINLRYTSKDATYDFWVSGPESSAAAVLAAYEEAKSSFTPIG